MAINVKLKTENNEDNVPQGSQSHVHEFSGSVMLAGPIIHNHRFAGVTGQVIPLPGGGHKHAFFANTDFDIGHLHEIAGETGPEIPVGNNGRHVHFAEVSTTLNLGHFHDAIFATLIENPLD